jgi:CSLREA domain-containing protein
LSRPRYLEDHLKARVSLLVAVLFLFAAPNAFATTYTVDSTADEADVLPGTGGCLTSGVKCTLRAAIEESNASAGTRDEIEFAAAFDGQPADTIALGSSLPAIKDPVSILGGDCFGEDGPHSPCAGVEGISGAPALIVEDADGVVIEGLSVTGAQTAINVIDSSEEFTARNDWIGIKLGGGAGGNTTGIFLDPDSDKALIGGVEPQLRNLFGYNAGDGLDILGADEVEVLGNYFGAVPDESAIGPGGSTAAPNGKDIEVNSTSVGGFTAEGNRIGGALSTAAAATPACDGACNVISAGTLAGIDLQGNGGQEAPAGPTTILGNYIASTRPGPERCPTAPTGCSPGKRQASTWAALKATKRTTSPAAALAFSTKMAKGSKRSAMSSGPVRAVPISPRLEQAYSASPPTMRTRSWSTPT